MKHEFRRRRRPSTRIRGRGAVRQLSIGGFIDFLATGYATIADRKPPTLTAVRAA